MSSPWPFILPYAGTAPRFAAPPVHAGTGSAVLGRASIGAGFSIGAGAVVRADGNTISIGDDVHLGAGVTVHIVEDRYATRIGSGATAARGSVVHACEIGDRCLVGARAVVLDGARLDQGVALAADALVTPRAELDGGWLYAGLPARPVRRLEAGELEALHQVARTEDEPPPVPPAPGRGTGALYVAATARLAGPIAAEAGASIWFGCTLEAGEHPIRIGANTNIQDNSVLRAAAGPLTIGRNTTLGHNVTLTDCHIGDAALIGIGAVVAPGTVIDGDVLLAAGAHTEPGQHLEAGWLYAGRPAARTRPLDAAKRQMIARLAPHYVGYGRTFAALERAAAEAPAG